MKKELTLEEKLVDARATFRKYFLLSIKLREQLDEVMAERSRWSDTLSELMAEQEKSKGK